MAAYIDWLYSSVVASILPEPADDECQLAREFHALAKLYVFGEKVQDDYFCDATLRAIMALSKKRSACPAPDSAIVIYEGTPEGSPARLLLVHLYQIAANRDMMEWEANKNCLFEVPEFLFDLALGSIPIARYEKDEPKDAYAIRRKWLKVKK